MVRQKSPKIKAETNRGFDAHGHVEKGVRVVGADAHFLLADYSHEEVAVVEYHREPCFVVERETVAGVVWVADISVSEADARCNGCPDEPFLGKHPVVAVSELESVIVAFGAVFVSRQGGRQVLFHLVGQFAEVE